MKQRLIGIFCILSVMVLFQNCSKKIGFDTQASSSSAESSNVNANTSNSANSNLNQNSTNSKTTFRVEDESEGDGQILLRIKQRVIGAGAGVRACTGLYSNYAKDCIKDSEFRSLVEAWPNSYNATTDIYSMDGVVSGDGWPHAKYFTKFKFENGEVKEATFEPVKVQVQKSLKWVITFSQFCVGPTPSAAPVGETCSSEGEARTNACGTVTCLYK